MIHPTTGRRILYWPSQHDIAGPRDPIGIIDASAPCDAGIEQQIQANGLTAPRITPAAIEDNIACEYSFNAADVLRDCPTHESLGLLTFCVLVLRNGFTVTGESACASPQNFDADIGRQIARQKAVQKIWPLMGYELRSKLAAA